MSTTTIVAHKVLQWDNKMRDLIKRTIAPSGTTETEFEFFASWCQRTGLDPLINQAFFIERMSKDAKTNTWISKKVPMAAESGMAAIADSQPDFKGMACGVVYEGDEFSVDEAAGVVVHKWNASARMAAGNIVLGAWAKIVREGRTTPITYLPIGTRIQKTKEGNATKFWATDPAGMILKCARSDQYRRVYPNLFSGVYIPEENFEEPGVTIDAEVVPAPKAMDAATQKAVEVLQEKTGFEPQEQKPFIVPIGQQKGEPITKMTDEWLVKMRSRMEAEIANPDKASFIQFHQTILDAVLSEQERR